MAAGGWLTTAPDLVRFMNAWMAEKLVSAPTMKSMLEPYKIQSGTIDNFGLGRFIDDYHGMKAGLYGRQSPRPEMLPHEISAHRFCPSLVHFYARGMKRLGCG